jgi:HAD superfamily hydrolase (TIGR01458 family)
MNDQSCTLTNRTFPPLEPTVFLNTMPTAFLLDLDGTLFTSDGIIPGAVETIETLRARGVPFRLLTNTTMRSRAQLLAHVRDLGFSVTADELFTPSVAAAALLADRGCRTVAPFVPEAAMHDLSNLEFVGGVTDVMPGRIPDAVVMGDLGDRWDAKLLNAAFRYVLDGALFVALQKGRYWLAPGGPLLDAGAYVTAVEYGTRQEAIVCGKPEAPFFEAALESLYADGVARDDPSSIVMIGDDIWNDVYGAQQVGIQGWLVRTGKFNEKVLRVGDVEPDRVIDSIAEIRHG